MTALMPATLYVNPDEPVYVMAEVDLPVPKGPKHRFNLLYVNRDDALAEYRQDLGLAATFDAPPFRQVVLWEHSVAECLDIADHLRWGDTYWQKRTNEIQEASTLTMDFLDAMGEARKQRANQSTYGPLFTRQRNRF